MVVTGESLLCTAIMDEEEESYVGTSSEENLEQDSLEVCQNEVQDSVFWTLKTRNFIRCTCGLLRGTRTDNKRLRNIFFESMFKYKALEVRKTSPRRAQIKSD